MASTWHCFSTFANQDSEEMESTSLASKWLFATGRHLHVDITLQVWMMGVLRHLMQSIPSNRYYHTIRMHVCEFKKSNQFYLNKIYCRNYLLHDSK